MLSQVTQGGAVGTPGRVRDAEMECFSVFAGNGGSLSGATSGGIKGQAKACPTKQKNSSDTKRQMGRTMLQNGDGVVIVGGGPAGSFFAIYLLREAKRLGRHIDAVIVEKRGTIEPGAEGFQC